MERVRLGTARPKKRTPALLPLLPSIPHALHHTSARTSTSSSAEPSGSVFRGPGVASGPRASPAPAAAAGLLAPEPLLAPAEGRAEANGETGPGSESGPGLPGGAAGRGVSPPRRRRGDRLPADGWRAARRIGWDDGDADACAPAPPGSAPACDTAGRGWHRLTWPGRGTAGLLVEAGPPRQGRSVSGGPGRAVEEQQEERRADAGPPPPPPPREGRIAVPFPLAVQDQVL